MSKPSKPTSIEELLAADRQTLSSWAEDVALEEPETLAHEEAMAQAWLGQQHKEETTVSWWQQWSATLVQWQLLLPASACLLAIGLWFSQTPSGLPSGTPKDTLLDKGSHTGTSVRNQSNRDIEFHLGTIQPNTTGISRLADGMTLRPTQDIYFTFTLKKPGYLYIWSRRKNRPTLLLLPAPGVEPTRWNKGLHTLKQNNKALRYRLRKHLGRLQFGAFLTTRPLNAQMERQLKRSTTPIALLQRWQARPKSPIASQTQMTFTIQPRDPL